MSKLIFGYARFQYIHGHHLTPHVKCISVSSCSNLPVHTAKYRLPCCNWGREQAVGHRVGTAMAVFALQLSTCPVLPFSKKTEKSLQTRSTEMPRGRQQRKHGAISVDLCSFAPTPHRKVAHCALGMRLGSVSLLVNLPFSSPVSTEPFTIYLLPLLSSYSISPCAYVRAEKVQQPSRGLRSLLVMVGLTFPVVISLCLLQS